MKKTSSASPRRLMAAALAVVAVSSPALAQPQSGRTFVGASMLADSAEYRQSLGVAGGFSVGWEKSDAWTIQVELEIPSEGRKATQTTSTAYCYAPGVPCGPTTYMSETRSRETTVAVLFGRRLPPVGRFRPTLLIGPSLVFDRETHTSEIRYGASAGAPARTDRYQDRHSLNVPMFDAGFDGEFVASPRMSIVPQLRLYTFVCEAEVATVIIRPGVSVRWRF